MAPVSPYRAGPRLDVRIPPDRRRLHATALAFASVLAGAVVMRSAEVVWAWSKVSPPAPVTSAHTPAPTPAPSSCAWRDPQGAEHVVMDSRCTHFDVSRCVWFEAGGAEHYFEEARTDDALWASCLQTVLADQGCTHPAHGFRSMHLETCQPGPDPRAVARQ